jgi:hypothetical protein
MRGFILGASLSVVFIAGCVASPYVLPPAHANQPNQVGLERWQYYCFSDGNTASTQSKANRAGHEGWEMAGQGNYDASESIWCFKRRM